MGRVLGNRQRKTKDCNQAIAKKKQEPLIVTPAHFTVNEVMRNHRHRMTDLLFGAGKIVIIVVTDGDRDDSTCGTQRQQATAV